jgi:modulator of FtsH protease HflK
MPWSNQSGGGGGGGGPWGGPPKNQSPWGQGPQPGGGNQPPDLEDLLRKGQDKLRGLFGGGSGGGSGAGFSGKAIASIALLIGLGWSLTGFYTIQPNEVGVETVFGRYSQRTVEGLNWNWPYPIGGVIKQTLVINRTEVGNRAPATANTRAQQASLDESLMLTGDGNIVDIAFDVQWRVDAAKVENYVFNLRNPAGTIKAVAESAMREVVGQRTIQPILTTDQAVVSAEVQRIMQQNLDQYGAGVNIILVQLQRAAPPPDVREFFLDVNAAEQDRLRAQEEARTYANEVIPRARGEATRLVQQAEAYRERTVAEAQGQASRFTQVYDEYRKAPAVTRERLFLETMERVLGGTDKIILDKNGGSGVVPYLPLNELQRRPQGPGQAQPQGATR